MNMPDSVTLTQALVRIATINPPGHEDRLVILGPGEPQMAHQTDEYCRVDRIVEAAALFTALIDDWCQAR